MATANTIADEWKVVILCEDEEKSKVYKFPKTSTVEEVKTKWSAFAQVPPDSVVLVTMDNAIVQDQQRLMDVGESFLGQKNITFNVEEAVAIYLELYKGSLDRIQVHARLSAPPEQLDDVVRREFDIPSNRYFQLRNGVEILTPGVLLRAQGIAAESTVFVELMFEIDVREAWTRRVDRFVLFSSDPCNLLMQDDPTGPQRLMCGRYTVDTGHEAADSLRPFGAPVQSFFSLRLEMLQDALVAAGERFRGRSVWPGDTVRQIVPCQSAATSSVMFNGSLVARSAKLDAADLPAYSLLHCDPVSLRVRTSDGRLHTVRVPRLGCVSDIKEAVRAKEKKTHFVLRRQGRELVEADSLTAAGLSPEDLVEVETTGLTLTVTLSDRSVRWRTHQRSLSFGDVVKEVSCRARMDSDHLESKTLLCSGCGRRVTKREEAFQAIPVQCCRVRSLVLEEPTTRDAETQTATVSRRSAVARSVARIAETANRGAQAVAFWHQAGAQTENERQVTGVQAEVPRVSNGQQHCPPRPRPFLIEHFTSPEGAKGYHRLVIDLHLLSQSTAGQVRDEVARAVGLPPERVRLRRYVGRRNEKEVFVICRGDGTLSGRTREWEFGNEDGEVWPSKDVTDRRLHFFENDNEHFLLAPERRNVITALLN